MLPDGLACSVPTLAQVGLWLSAQLTVLRLTCAVAAALALAWRARGPKRGAPGPREAPGEPGERREALEGLPRALNRGGGAGFPGLPGHVHLQGALLPDGRFGVGNPPEPYRFENEFCWGLLLPLFRPTRDAALDTPEGWAFGRHFADRRRLWELRLELHIKVPLEGPLLLGFMGHQYTPIGHKMRLVTEVIKATVKKLIGGSFYYSPGDGPEVRGERELPTCVVPLWVFDQFVETPEGGRPPGLLDPGFPELGRRRAEDYRGFLELMSGLQLRPGPTYSFGVWGISRLLDVLRWELQGFSPVGLDFNRFCGAPPVYWVLYTLAGEEPGDGRAWGRRRHLESRKRYYLRFAFWSSEKPPPLDVIRDLVPGGGGERAAPAQAPPDAPNSTARARCLNLASCCTVRGETRRP